MYNRYAQNDNGIYEPLSMPEMPPPPPPKQPHRQPPPREEQNIEQKLSDFLPRILEKVHLKDVDTADILLLLILFFLFEEKADDELLIALGLLLIL